VNQDFPSATPYFIYEGDRRYYVDDINILPMTDALWQLPTLLATPTKAV